MTTVPKQQRHTAACSFAHMNKGSIGVIFPARLTPFLKDPDPLLLSTLLAFNGTCSAFWSGYHNLGNKKYLKEKIDYQNRKCQK
jgi:hypothetical protein